MSPKDIKVGHTYCNRGAGRTRRTVLEIGTDIPVPWYSNKARPDSLVVRYQQKNIVETLYLCSFASWAGRDVTDDVEDES